MTPHPLSLATLIRRGAETHGASLVSTYDGERVSSASFAEVADRAAQLASALQQLGVRERHVIGACCWNTQHFLELFLAVPGIGALLHTINPRFSASQLDYVIRLAGEKTVVCDASLLPVLAGASEALKAIERLIVIGDEEAIDGFGGETIAYETLLHSGTEHEWVDRDELLPATLCFTTGTTGDPKGAAYTQRAIVLHSLGECTVNSLAVGEHDRVMPVSPMFHVNGWGLPYSAWLAGADILLPGRFVQASHLAKLLRENRPTLMAGVPTIFNDLRRHAEGETLDLSSLRLAMCGGAPVPRPIIEYFRDAHGLPLTQAWGMTENGLLTVARPPAGVTGTEELDWRARTGRLVAGVEARVVDDSGRTLPADGTAVGELEVRGWWVVDEYFGVADRSRFHDGWLRTGDLGTVSSDGWVQITDRSKDVIKSGGEWISSIALEAALMAHPAVHEAAVIAAPDERWSERPLACVVLSPDADASQEQLSAHLAGQVPRWWVPERYTFLEALPRTSVGKLDKKRLREALTEGEMVVSETVRSAPATGTA